MWKWMKNTSAHALSAVIALIVLVFAGQASAGANADAMLSLDLIPAGGAGNQRDDGVTTGRVSGRGTTIAIEVFATGVTTPLVGMQIVFDFDASLLTFVKAENSAFSLSIPGRQGKGTNFASDPPVTLGASGFLARAEFTTRTDVTGREFSIGIATLILAENSASSDAFMPTDRIAFNVTSTNFSLSLDADDAPGDQAVASAEVHPDSVVAIQVFGAQIQNITGITLRFEYDATQVAYDRFDRGGSVLPNVQSFEERGSNPTFVEIGIGSLGGRATVNSGLVGAVRFRTTAAFSGTAIRLTKADLYYGGVKTQTETLDVRVALVVPAAPSPDFNGDGEVGFPDFLLFAGQFGARRGDGMYEAKYDLDSDGEVGFSDFLIFSRSFGTSPGSGGGGGDSGQPDLIVEAPAVSNPTLAPGQSFSLRATVRNAGTGSSAVTTARYYRSSDATIAPGDTPVGSARVARLSASGTRDISISLKAPLRADTYYYGACVVRVRGERDTDNNCSEGVRVTVRRSTGETPPPPNNARYWRDRSDSEYQIAWSPSPDATFYRVYFDSAIIFSVSCPGGCALIATVTDSSARHDSGASRIGYWVRACNEAGCSNYVRAERVSGSGNGGGSDTYTPIAGLRVSNGRIQLASFSVENCISLDGIGGYEVHTSKWQRKSGTSWVDIPDTARMGEVCAYSTTTPGEYRLVGDVSINGVRGRHRSENTFTVN